MRKFRLLGVTLFAVFALGAVVVSSAFAAAEWLVGGEPVTAELLVEASGELTLIHLAGGFLEPEATIKCSGIFVGAVLPAGLDVISELLSLTEVKVETGKPLSCSKVTTCENGSTVVAEDFPWATQLTLMAVGGGSIYLDLLSAGPNGLPGYLIDCLFLGEQVVLCEGETSATVTLSGTSLIGTFNAKELETEKLEGSCGGTANVALQEGSGTITLNGGGELDVSDSAFAAGEWLVNGAKVETELLVESSGEFTLIHLPEGFLESEASIKCSGIFVGAVLPSGLDVISELLTLEKVKVEAGKPLSCTGIKSCEAGSTVVAEDFPWATQLESMAVGGGSTYLDLFSAGPNGLPGYLLDCLLLGEHMVLCEGETSATVTLSGTSLISTFVAEELETEKLEGSCGGTADVALQEGSGTITLTEGGELDVSPPAPPPFAAGEWLVAGAAVTAELLVEASGELTLINLAGGFLEPEAVIKCSGIFDGAVLPAGLDVISELLTLEKVKVETGKPLSCSKVKTCENGSTVVAEDFPWTTQLELMAVGGGSIYLDLFSADGNGLPGYLIDCLFLGEQIVLCEGETSAKLTLSGTSLVGTFTSAELETEKLEGSCGTTANVVLPEGSGTITLNEGGELDVSG